MNISAISFLPKAFKCSFGNSEKQEYRLWALLPGEYVDTNANGDKFIRSKNRDSEIVRFLSSDQYVKADADGAEYVYTTSYQTALKDFEELDEILSDPVEYAKIKKEREEEKVPWYAPSDYAIEESASGMPYFP